MRIPPDAIIPDDKLTRYLLVPRASDDKSRYLLRAGFTANDPEALRGAIRGLIQRTEATEDGANEYGAFWRVEGLLGDKLPVVLIWMRRHDDGLFHFITLKPPPRRQGTRP